VKIVIITIGNTDNKLTQQQWSAFCVDLSMLVKQHSEEVYFLGHSPSDTPWQNMQTSFRMRSSAVGGMIPWLRTKLTELAREYNQDAIALLVVDPDDIEMIRP
jgi:hypothetical protein